MNSIYTGDRATTPIPTSPTIESTIWGQGYESGRGRGRGRAILDRGRAQEAADQVYQSLVTHILPYIIVKMLKR